MRHACVLLLALGCAPSTDAPAPADGPAPPPDTAAPPPPTDGDTATTATTPPTPAYDCGALPAGPLPIDPLAFLTEEDFDFDHAGYLLAQSGTDLVGHDRFGGFVLVAPDVAGDATGIQVLASGDVAVANPGTGSLVYVHRETGASEPLAGGLASPNGLEAAAGNVVFFSEREGGRVRWIDADDHDGGLVADGLVRPNGLAFGPAEATLYVAGQDGDDYAILAIDRDGAGWAPPRVLARSDRELDGVETDVCGNVYTVEYATGHLLRIDPTTGARAIVADIEGVGEFSSLRWGSGIGGWGASVLYVTNRWKLYAVDAGVPGTPDPADP